MGNKHGTGNREKNGETTHDSEIIITGPRKQTGSGNKPGRGKYIKGQGKTGETTQDGEIIITGTRKKRE